MKGPSVVLEGYFLYPTARPTTVKTAPTKAPSICFQPKPGEPPNPMGSATIARIKMTAPTPNRTTPVVFFPPMIEKDFEVYSVLESLAYSPHSMYPSNLQLNTEYPNSKSHVLVILLILPKWAKPKIGKREPVLYFDFNRLTTSAYVRLALLFTRECIIPAA